RGFHVTGVQTCALPIYLIYGTPGESLDDWRRSLEAVLALEPDHVSAYALTIEPGTRMHTRVRRGELPGVDGDDQAAKYELADTLDRKSVVEGNGVARRG